MTEDGTSQVTFFVEEDKVYINAKTGEMILDGRGDTMSNMFGVNLIGLSKYKHPYIRNKKWITSLY